MPNINTGSAGVRKITANCGSASEKGGDTMPSWNTGSAGARNAGANTGSAGVPRRPRPVKKTR